MRSTSSINSLKFSSSSSLNTTGLLYHFLSDSETFLASSFIKSLWFTSDSDDTFFPFSFLEISSSLSRVISSSSVKFSFTDSSSISSFESSDSIDFLASEVIGDTILFSPVSLLSPEAFEKGFSSPFSLSNSRVISPLSSLVEV